MCDVFGPPVRGHAFQRHEVYRSRSNDYFVFGIDKVSQEYSTLRIRAREDGELELQGGEERLPMGRGGSLLEQFRGELEQREGELRLQAKASGIMGFIRFLQGPYLVLVTKRTQVGKIGHHRVMSIETTKLEPLFPETIASKYTGEERAFCNQFGALNLSKDFYFSYTYDLSCTVQQNLADAMAAGRDPKLRAPLTETNSLKHHRFVWNHYLMKPLLEKPGWRHWCLPVIHGFFQYAKCSSFGWAFEVALIARRSRFYAGTRFRKRGLNVDGQAANDVETEQLVCDDSTRHLTHGHVMSFVQMRGSVPLFWSQEVTAMNPKPPVEYPRCDPTLAATRRHFSDLMERYGEPVCVVNLMKAQKADSCESRLGKHFEAALERMNRELPASSRILYRSFDMKHHSKNSNLDKIQGGLAESVVQRVGFFHTCSGLSGPPERIQSGVVRTNCVDCLDRTNVFQYFVGLEALKQQLAALNLLPEPCLDSSAHSSCVVIILRELYDLMGDHLALQYAGSVAHKKYQLLGSRPRMMHQGKEWLISLNRHYSNVKTDAERQSSINLLLGLYRPRDYPHLSSQHDCDSWLHHRVLRDNFSPGSWWEAALRVHGEAVSALRFPAVPPSLSQDQSLFWRVHGVWKLTQFEKLLSRLEDWGTNVQINGSRQLSTLRPYRAILERGGPRPGRWALAHEGAAESPVAPLEPSDEDVYSSYASDCQWIWSKGLARAAAGPLLPEADFKLARHEEAACSQRRSDEHCGGPLDQLLESLARRYAEPRPRRSSRAEKAGKLEREELRHVVATYNVLFQDRRPSASTAGVCVDDAIDGRRSDMTLEAFLGLDERPRSSSSCILARMATGGSRSPRRLSRKRSGSTAQLVTGEGQLAGRTRESPSPQYGTPQSRGPASAVRMRLRFCSYCEEPFQSEDFQDGLPLTPDGRWSASAEACSKSSASSSAPTPARPRQRLLCPRHRCRAQELERICESEDLRRSPQRSQPSSPHEHDRRPCAVVISMPAGRAGRQKPWKDWLRHRPPEAAPGGAAADRAAPERGGAEPEAPGSSRQCLYSFAFPHAAPRPPEAQDLGLPEWWLSSLRSSRPAAEEPPPAPPRADGGQAQGGRPQPGGAAPGPAAASCGAPGDGARPRDPRAHCRPQAPARAEPAAPPNPRRERHYHHGVEKDAPASFAYRDGLPQGEQYHSTTQGEQYRSIFSGKGVSVALEEIIGSKAASRSDSTSPTSPSPGAALRQRQQLSQQRPFGGGHRRVRSAM